MTIRESTAVEKWINYLYSLGPSSGNDNAYDESLTMDLLSSEIAPIEIACDFDSDIVEKIRYCASTGESALVLLTGMAGDGKTRTARVVWTELTQADLCFWNQEPEPKAELASPSGQSYTVVFSKDLSANMDNEGPLDLFSVPANSCRVVACNHGRILDRIRALEGNNSKLAQDIELALFEKIKQKDFVSSTGLKVCVFDLSMYDPAQKFEDILVAMLNRPEWSGCLNCAHCSKCMIFHNRNALWEDTEKKLKTPAKRQAELARLISCSGIHLPIRDLLIVAANNLLGAHTPGSTRKRKRLISCSDVRQSHSKKSLLESYVFANLLGENLQETERKKNLLFREFPSFGIGHYGPRAVDEILQNPSRFPELRSLVGEPIAELLWDRNPDSEKKLAKELLALRRQSMFFTYPESKGTFEGFDRWQLTAFSFGGRYVRLLSDLAKHTTYVFSDLILGMNRVFTGQYTVNNKSVVCVTTSGTNSKSIQGELLRCELSVRSSKSTTNVIIALNQAKLPVLVFTEASETLKVILTPYLFEYFMRAANGYIPDSLSKESHSQALQLKFKLIERFAGQLDDNYELCLETLEKPSGARQQINVNIDNV